MKHIIVTGGAGFIGSHLCESLIEKGYAVTAIDNLSTGRVENLESLQQSDRFHFLKTNVSEPLRVDEIKFLSQFGLEGLFHFACPASPVDFEKIPFEILKVDSLGTFHTVDLALRYGAKYVLASTSEIYGDPEVHPQKETYFGNVNTIGPRACYDETKRFAEAVVTSAMRGAGLWEGKSYQPLNGRIVRIFNTYGPRMRLDDGRVVPDFCKRALVGDPLQVYGSGDQTRSFCYVSDLVNGILKLYESDAKLPINIGNPQERTILEFAEKVLEITGSHSGIEKKVARPDDPKRRCPDISRAQSELDWSPKIELHDGLVKTIEYFKTQR